MENASEASSPPQKKPIGKRLKGLSRRKRRRIIQIGCIPSALVMGLCLWGMVVLYVEVDSYYYTYSVEDHLHTFGVATVIIAAILQMLATWIMTWMVAAAAAQTVSGGEQTLSLRQRVIFRRWLVSPLAVFLLRLILLGGIAFLVVIFTTYIFGSTVYVDILDTIRDSLHFAVNLPGYRLYVVLAIYTTVIFVLTMLVGPFLRVRYNLALGTLVSTYPRRRYQRPWTAVSFRLGLGMFTTLCLVWGGSLLSLIFLIIVDPFYDSSTELYDAAWRAVPVIVDDVFIYAALIAVLLTINLIGQIVLPFVFNRLSKKRLSRKNEKGTPV